MARPSADDGSPLDAGDFSAWLAHIRGAIRGEHDAHVPCGGCTACCTSAQFVHIAPDETDTLAHLPAALLFPAPLLPPGHLVLGYDEHGHCPMLVDGACSIYAHRPRTCRTYDCRVFTAAGVEPDDDKPSITKQVGRWRFTYATATGATEHDAVRATAVSLRRSTEHRPPSTTQLAVRAVLTATGVALDPDQAGKT